MATSHERRSCHREDLELPPLLNGTELRLGDFAGVPRLALPPGPGQCTARAPPGRVLLRSEGLDTLATVTLNGEHIAETSNMFHRPVWDVSSVFKPAASNTLEIAFASPATYSTAASVCVSQGLR